MEQSEEEVLLEENEDAAEGSGSMSPTEGSYSENNDVESSVSSGSNPSDLVQKLQEEVSGVIAWDVPELEEDEPVLTAQIVKSLAKLSLETESHQEIECSVEKAEDLLNEDVENCAVLVDLLSKRIKKLQERKELIKQHRKILNNLMQSLSNYRAGSTVDMHEQILRKVTEKFKHYRNELRDLLEIWDEDHAEEINEIMANATKAYIEETGPHGQYIVVTGFDREIVQLLVSRRIIMWNKEETHIKLFI